MSRGQGNGNRTKASTENGNKKFEKISKKVLTNDTKYGIISMSGERNRHQAKASLETETKKHLTNKTKYGIMIIPKEKRGLDKPL